MATNLNWDTIFSNYWWTIELDPLHPENKSNIELSGYSKAQGQRETADKHQRLCSIVLMFVQRRYIDKCKIIKLYKRSSSFIDKNNDNICLELYPGDFILHPIYTDRRTEMIMFLKTVYNEVLKGRSVEYLKPKKQINLKANIDEELNIDKYYIVTHEQLHSTVERLLSNGHSRKAVEHFYIKYTEKLERKNLQR